MLNIDVTPCPGIALRRSRYAQPGLACLIRRASSAALTMRLFLPLRSMLKVGISWTSMS